MSLSVSRGCMRTMRNTVLNLSAAAVIVFFFAAGVHAQGPVFGPTQFTRGAGAPQTVTASFPKCGAGACQITVTNGNPDGSSRVSSARITLNGVELFGPQ